MSPVSVQNPDAPPPPVAMFHSVPGREGSLRSVGVGAAHPLRPRRRESGHTVPSSLRPLSVLPLSLLSPRPFLPPSSPRSQAVGVSFHSVPRSRVVHYAPATSYSAASQHPMPLSIGYSGGVRPLPAEPDDFPPGWESCLWTVSDAVTPNSADGTGRGGGTIQATSARSALCRLARLAPLSPSSRLSSISF